MSPGTRSLDGTSSSLPPRSTVIIGVSMLFSASSAFSARYSCTKPSTAQNRMMTPMMIASTYSPTKAESTVATIRMTTRMFLNWLKKSAQGDAFSSCSQLVRTVLGEPRRGLLRGRDLDPGRPAAPLDRGILTSSECQS